MFVGANGGTLKNKLVVTNLEELIKCFICLERVCGATMCPNC